MQEIQQPEGTPVPEVEARPRKKGLIREILEVIIIVFLIFAASRLIVHSFRIQGESMAPTLHDGQFLIFYRLPYYFHGPQRGDVIAFLTPEAPADPCANPLKKFVLDLSTVVGQNNSCQELIKRVVGLPGEEVEIRLGIVYINGQALNEPYLSEIWQDTMLPWVLGADEYFVLGDHRKVSGDSRALGGVPRENIVGRAWLSYWPPAYWGLIPRYSY